MPHSVIPNPKIARESDIWMKDSGYCPGPLRHRPVPGRQLQKTAGASRVSLQSGWWIQAQAISDAAQPCGFWRICLTNNSRVYGESWPAVKDKMEPCHASATHTANFSLPDRVLVAGGIHLLFTGWQHDRRLPCLKKTRTVFL